MSTKNKDPPRESYFIIFPCTERAIATISSLVKSWEARIKSTPLYVHVNVPFVIAPTANPKSIGSPLTVVDTFAVGTACAFLVQA